MKVSICIPSYNLGDVIDQTIESVIAQTFTDWELLIEDDGSTDNSVQVIEKYLSDPRIRLFVKEKNEGQNRTTNNLIARAQGEYICLLPGDDVIVKDKVEKQVKHLNEHPECGIIFGYPEFMDHRNIPMEFSDKSVQKLENKSRDYWQRRFMVGNCLFIATSMYRRSLHDTLGMIDEDFHILADLDWYMRIVRANELYIIPETLAHIRMRDGMANLSAPTVQTQEKHADEITKLRAKYNPVKLRQKKYMIATPFYEVKGYSPYIRSIVTALVGLAKHTDIEFEYVELAGDSYVWRARNTIAARFMKSDCTDLIFIDSDEGFEPEALYRLIKADKDFVGCVYPVKNKWQEFGCTIHVDSENFPIVEKETGLIRAEKVPTGFLKIRRNVFQSIKDHFPDEWYWEPDEYETMNKTYDYFGHMTENHVKYGEDISFGRRWLATGGEIWIEPRATIEHIGTQVWVGNYHEMLSSQPGGVNSDNHIPYEQRKISKEESEHRLGVAYKEAA